jgi:F-type H+-transporting ATPase subunit epsilon
MKALVISPERVLFEGEVSSVFAPAFDGEVGILPKHAPMVTLLGRGVLRLGLTRGGHAEEEGRQQGGGGPVGEEGLAGVAGVGGVGGRAAERRFDVSGGFLQVADDVVRLVTEQASPVGATPLPARGAKA